MNRAVALPDTGLIQWYRDPRFLTVGLGTAVALAWFLADLGEHATQVRVCWAVLVLQAAGLVWLADRVVRLLDRREPAHRFWSAMRGACVLFTIGNVAQLVTVINNPLGPAAAVGGDANSFLLAIGTAWLVIVMIRYPMHFGSSPERVRFWLDIATVVAGVGSFGWYFAVPEAGFGPRAESLPGVLTILQGPVAQLVAAFAVAKLVISGAAVFSRLAGIFGGTCAVTAGVARVMGPTLLETAHANLFFAATVLGPSLTLVGVLAHERWLRSRPVPSEPIRKRPYSTLPYFAMAATYGLLIVVVLRQELDARAWGVLVGATASAVLIIVRQLAAFSENTRLIGQLQNALGERDALADALRQQAFYDNLTGLANRALLSDKLRLEFDRARRQHCSVVVMLIDLDDFKPVNDRFGHHAGDLLLCQVGGRLRRIVAKTDTVARFGGDEFAILMCSRPESIVAMAERILADLDEPFQLTDHKVEVHASVGIAIDTDGSWGADQILRNADAAMYAAKAKGKGTFAIFQQAVEP